MSVVSQDIKMYDSLGLGGDIDLGAEITGNIHEVFPSVTSAQAAAGLTDYACIYVKNTNADTDLSAVNANVSSNTTSGSTAILIGAGTSAVNVAEQTIANSTTAPIGVTFDSNNAALASLPPAGYVSIWIKRVVDAAAPLTPSDACEITISGDSL